MTEGAQAEEIIGRLLDLFRRMQAAFAEAADGLGLSPAEARTLHWLDRPAPMGAMAEALHCDASYVTVIGDRLESLGLVKRVADPDDRRVRQLVLTTKGRRLRSSLVKRVHATSPAVASLNAQEREQLLSLLSRVSQPPTGCT